VFLLYRWPEATLWAESVPPQLQTLPEYCHTDSVYVSIQLNFDRGRHLQRSAETGTACAVYNVSAETAEQRASLVESFNQAVGATPLFCREDSTRKPRSVLMWLPLEDAIQKVSGRDVELQDLVDAGRSSLLRALENMVEIMEPHLNYGTAKRRHKADALQVGRALQAAEPPVSVVNALFRRVAPLVSPELQAERRSPAVKSFASALTDTVPNQNIGNLRSGLLNRDQSLPAALRSVLEELARETSEKLRCGVAGCPRTGYLRPPPLKRRAGPSKGIGKSRQRASSTRASDASKVLMMHELSDLRCQLPDSGGKLCGLWIADLKVVNTWMQGGWKQGVPTVYMLGVVRLVSSVSPCGRQTTVQPAVKALPCLRDGSLVSLSQEDPVKVVTVLLSDFHEAFYVHEALRVAHSRAPVTTSMGTLCTGLSPSSGIIGDRMLRILLGLRVAPAEDTVSCIVHALGPEGSIERAFLIKRAERFLELTLLPEQRNLVLSLASDVVEAQAVPGAGKTTLIEVLVVMVLLHSPSIKLLIVEPTRDMCAVAEARLRRSAEKAGFERTVARIGQCPESSEDYMEKFLRKHLTERTAQFDAVLKAVDSCVEVLREHAFVAGEFAATGAAATVICMLLACRHAFLDQHYYRKRQDARAKLVKEVRVLIMTPSKAAELRSGTGDWSELLCDTSVTWGVLVDEEQRFFWKLLLATVLGCSFVVCTGDTHQGRDPRGARTPKLVVDDGEAIGSVKSLCRDDPLRLPFKMVPSWFKGAPDVQQAPMNESFRLGGTNVALIKYMFPGRHDDMVSTRGQPGDPRDSLVLLTLFSRLYDWIYKTGDGEDQEIVWSPTFGRHVLYLLAIELVALINWPHGLHRERSKGVLIISFLKSFLGSLEQFLAANLASQCYFVHRAHALQKLPEGDTTYSFESLCARGLLSFHATLASGGSDGMVAFLCLPQRQKDDWAWRGACTERHLQLIGVSRASQRFHIIAEDLRPEVTVPRRNHPLVQ